jgi:biopolymer transport protein ExbD
MSRKRAQIDEEASIDMTPMLDIVFIMLIFFIVSTSFLKEKGIEINKPKPSKNKTPPNAKRPIFIEINDDGEIWMDKRMVDVERVGANVERLLANNNSETVIIKAGKKAKHGLVVGVMDAVKIANSGLNISIANP